MKQNVEGVELPERAACSEDVTGHVVCIPAVRRDRSLSSLLLPLCKDVLGLSPGITESVHSICSRKNTPSIVSTRHQVLSSCSKKQLNT
ncbi:hypothetical protein AMELA_G00040660 [Ameiurus melas]|uniref:Uncharacterized protein n=1 Tax=Ameiurus melas TaxID=219545 RepID=A0A7J6BCB1_AMEME|nr:hypothetical protein AMELA_G00040660 [Ameiurus melas]